jgi:hypothetical protein
MSVHIYYAANLSLKKGWNILKEIKTPDPVNDWENFSLATAPLANPGGGKTGFVDSTIPILSGSYLSPGNWETINWGAFDLEALTLPEGVTVRGAEQTLYEGIIQLDGGYDELKTQLIAILEEGSVADLYWSYPGLSGLTGGWIWRKGSFDVYLSKAVYNDENLVEIYIQTMPH